MMPKYEHTQKGSHLVYCIAIFMIFELIAMEAIVYVVGTRSEEPLSQHLWFTMLLIALVPGLILGWVLLMMSSLTVSIGQDFVRIRFGGRMWRKTISLEKIVACRSVKNDWINGWGIRYIGKKCWLYNIAGMEAVELTFKNGKKTRIGTDEPEKLADAISAAIALK